MFLLLIFLSNFLGRLKAAAILNNTFAELELPESCEEFYRGLCVVPLAADVKLELSALVMFAMRTAGFFCGQYAGFLSKTF